MTDYDIKHLVPPVYLGFGNLAWHKRYSKKAEQFFNATIGKCGMKYLAPIFQHNNFTHPLYLMRYAKNRPEYIKYRMKFKQNTLIPTGVETAISDAKSTPNKHIPNMERAKRQEERQKVADEVFDYLRNQKGYQVIAIKGKNGISFCSDAVHLVINSNKNEAVHLFVNCETKGMSKESMESFKIKINVILYLSVHKGIFQERNVNTKPYGFCRKSPHLRCASGSIFRKSVALFVLSTRGMFNR
ncbi:hypothetical protein [Bacteroides sp.]|uniref:hypothetical protein n=1 Tax=Bacteroides sp. TaxID=29523 RepID=UPI0025B94C64|nr:hypothetical protein [Bacteroides sp.]